MEPLRRPETSVGAVVIVDGHILMIERGREPAIGLWSVPGGRVEFGETLARAVEREVAEETGLEVTCGPFIGLVERLTASHHHVILDFWALPVEEAGLVPLVADDDASEAAWVAIAELANLPLVEGLLEFLFDSGVLGTDV